MYYPSNLKAVFSYMSYSNFENPATQYLSEFILKSIGVVTISVNSELDQMGFKSSNILINSLDKIILVFLLLTFTIIVALLFRWIKTKDKLVRKACHQT